MKKRLQFLPLCNRLLVLLLAIILFFGLIISNFLLSAYATNDAEGTETSRYPGANGVSFSLDPATTNGAKDTIHMLRTSAQELDAEVPKSISVLFRYDQGEYGALISNNKSNTENDFGRSVQLELAALGDRRLRLTIRYYVASGSSKGWNNKTFYSCGENETTGKVDTDWNLATIVFTGTYIKWYVNGNYIKQDSFKVDMQTVSNKSRNLDRPLLIGGSYLTNSMNSQSNGYVSSLDIFTDPTNADGLGSLNYNNNYNSWAFTGDIAYASIWSTVRTDDDIASEAADLMANPTNIPTDNDGLLGSWSFAGNGDILTTTYEDKSGKGNHVTPYCKLLKDYDLSYLRSVGASTEFATGDYSIAIIPDTQYFVLPRKSGSIDTFDTEDTIAGTTTNYFAYRKWLPYYTQWIADHKDNYNILAYMHMGDVTNDRTNTEQWNLAKSAFKKLLDAGLRGIPMRGNHDSSTPYNEKIGALGYSSQSWFGGAYDDPAIETDNGSLDNTYWFIETGDRTYLVFSLGYSTRKVALTNSNGNGDPNNSAELNYNIYKDEGLKQWVKSVIETYPGANVIVTAHTGMSRFEFQAESNAFYEEVLKPYDNVVLQCFGHNGTELVVCNTSRTNGAGKNYPCLMVDPQMYEKNEGLLGLVALLTFHDGSDEVSLNWYSTRYESLYGIDSQYTITVPHVKSSLNTAVISASELTEEGYTTDSWSAFKTALESATAVLKDITKGTAAAGEAESALMSARSALVLKEDTSEPSVENLSDATVTLPSNGWIEGTNTFTVSSDAPCVVAISNDNGVTYTRLNASETDKEGTYSFTAEGVTAGTKIAIIQVGDANGDGSITNADATRAKQIYAGVINDASVLELLAADTNDDGKVTNADATAIKFAFAGAGTLVW